MRPDILPIWRLLFVVLLVPLTGCHDEKELGVVGDWSYAPYESCSSIGGEARGILVEQWRLVARRAGLKINYTCLDWNDALNAIDTGKAAAIGGMTRSAKREEKFDFIRKITSASSGYSFLYYNVDVFPSEPTIELLTSKKTPIGIVAGDYGQEWSSQNYPELKIDAYPSYRPVVEAAASGNLLAFFMQEAVASKHLSELGIARKFKRSTKLSITHIFRADVDTDLDVGKAGQAAPHDNVAGRWIAGSREVAAEARQLREVVR